MWPGDLSVKIAGVWNANFLSLNLKRDLEQQLDHVSLQAKIISLIKYHYACQTFSINVYKEITLDVPDITKNIQELKE